MTDLGDRLAAVVTSEGMSVIRCPRARVLLVLLLYGGRNGQAYPSVARVAELSRTPERNVRRALVALERSGLIRCVRRSAGGRGQTSRYEVAPAAVDGAFARVTSGTLAGGARVSGANPGPENPGPTGPGLPQKPGFLGYETLASQARNPGSLGQGNSEEPREPQSAHARGGGPADQEEAEDLIPDLAAALRELELAALAQPYQRWRKARELADHQLTPEDLALLAGRARGGREPCALLWHWLRDPALARDELLDARGEPREAARMARSVRARRSDDDHGQTEPRPVGDILDDLRPNLGEAAP